MQGRCCLGQTGTQMETNACHSFSSGWSQHCWMGQDLRCYSHLATSCSSLPVCITYYFTYLLNTTTNGFPFTCMEQLQKYNFSMKSLISTTFYLMHEIHNNWTHINIQSAVFAKIIFRQFLNSFIFIYFVQINRVYIHINTRLQKQISKSFQIEIGTTPSNDFKIKILSRC